MPDRGRGYVRRGDGILGPDSRRANQYRRNAREDAVLFDGRIQQLLIDEVQVACRRQSYRLHACTTEPTHVHVLVDWVTDRGWLSVRSGLKSSLTRWLNSELQRREHRFSRSASRKRVKDMQHFNYLLHEYLPKHGGLQWYNDHDSTSSCGATPR